MMGRLVLHWVCVFALVALPVGGCSDETTAAGGTGGSGDTGGNGGMGGNPFPCEAEGSAAPCDGTVCPCTLEGIRGAVAEGGGPYTFDCEGSTIITSENAPSSDRVIIDNSVQLDAGGNITLVAIGFRVCEGVTAAVADMTIEGLRGGNAIDNEGTLTLTRVTLTDNTASNAQGGLLAVVANLGTLTITESSLTENSGGNIVASYGHLTIVRSTIADNEGLGVWVVNEGPVLIEDSTISGNLWGISSCTTRPTEVINGTVSGNNDRDVQGDVTVINSTIVGRVTVDDRSGCETGPVLRGTVIQGTCEVAVTSGDFNIESPGNTCAFDGPGDQPSMSTEELNLGPLQDNGGPTMTHALLPGSVAIDVIPADRCDVDADQRGEPRPGGAMCDVGSFELQP